MKTTGQSGCVISHHRYLLATQFLPRVRKSVTQNAEPFFFHCPPYGIYLHCLPGTHSLGQNKLHPKPHIVFTANRKNNVAHLYFKCLENCVVSCTSRNYCTVDR